MGETKVIVIFEIIKIIYIIILVNLASILIKMTKIIITEIVTVLILFNNMKIMAPSKYIL